MAGDEDLPDIAIPHLRSCDFTSDGCTDENCGYCYGQGPRYNREAQLEAQVAALQERVSMLEAELLRRADMTDDRCDHMRGAFGSCARCEGT